MTKKRNVVPEPQEKVELAHLNVMIPKKMRRNIDIIGIGRPSIGARYIFARFEKQIEAMATKALEKEKSKKVSKKSPSK